MRRSSAGSTAPAGAVADSRPREQPEATPARRGEDRVAVVRDELILDAALGLARGDVVRDHPFDLLRGRRLGLVERRAADGAHDLALELRLRGVAVARCGDRRERERGDGDGKEPFHDCEIRRRYRGRSSSAAICPTTFPLRSTKKMLGRSVRFTQRSRTAPLPSWTLGYVMPYLRSQARASPAKSFVSTPMNAIVSP